MRHPSKLLVTSFSALALLLAAAEALAQDTAPTAVIVVDGSGSMWGNLGTDKRPKIEMVREALRALLPSLRTDARVGLASFGHRRRGNCGDAEVIVPPELDSAVRMSVPVEKMNAMGKAPIALALRESATAIAGVTPASIVLVADDLDNCGQDVCAAIGELCLQPGTWLFTRSPSASTSRNWIRSAASRARRAANYGTCRTLPALTSALGQAVTLANLQSAPSAPAPEPAQGEPPPKKPDPGAPPGLYLSAGLGSSKARRSTVPCIGGLPGPAPMER